MKDTDFKILGKRLVPNLQMRKASYVQGAQSSNHNHENARFVFVLRGNFSEIYTGKKRECQPFTAIFRPPNEEHSDDYYGRGIICLSVEVQPEWLARVNQYDLKLKDSADFRGGTLPFLISKLASEFDKQDNTSALAIEGVMLEITVEILRSENRNLPKEVIPKWLFNARDFIHAEFTQNPSIAEIAAAVNVHPVHLARVFRRQFNCTIADYIRPLKVEAAKQALASTDTPLADIALDTGFPDQSHFSKTFKRLTNITPAEYRKLMRLR
jgi:AraC family transcriptional regulator